MTTIWRRAVVVLGLLLSNSCREEAKPTPARGALPVTVAAPGSLVMQGVIAGPQVFWQDVRTGLGEEGRRLPKHFPLLVTELLGVSPVISGRFELNEPIRVALGVDGARLRWALALRVRSGAELVAELSTGATAPYRVTRNPHLQELARPGAEEIVARGVSSNWLVLASDSETLRAYAPYLAFTRVEDTTTAQTGRLALTSTPAAGAKLAEFWRDWWTRSGESLRGDMSLMTGDLSAEFAATELSRLAAHVARGAETLLRGLVRSRFELGVDGTHFVLTGQHETAQRWRPAADNCQVLSKSPYLPTLAAFAWGAEGALELPLTDGALELRAPMLLGVAEHEHATVGFADVSSNLAPDAAARRLHELFARKAPESTKTDRPWTVKSRVKAGAREWTFSPVQSARAATPSRALRLVLLAAGEAHEDRSRWLVLADGSELPGWGTPGAELPWSPACERLLFGAALGAPPNAIALWVASTKTGVELQGRAPLRSFAEL